MQGTNNELPQFPGVVFGARGIDLDHEAETNEAAIRASLIHFKHRWPGQAVVLEGSDAFRLKVWAIAEEVGVPLHGPRPGSGSMALHGPTNRRRSQIVVTDGTGSLPSGRFAPVSFSFFSWHLFGRGT